MTVRMLMQFAGTWLGGWLVGYGMAVVQGSKDRKKHQLQVDHLRSRLRTRL